MENVVDLRLIGAMTCLAYLTWFFVGDSVNPLARSRRALRRLRQDYGRSLALVLLISPAVSLWVPVQSVSDGILLCLVVAIVPLCLLSLAYGYLAFRYWRIRRRERLDPDFRAREQPRPVTLEQLQDQTSSAQAETQSSPTQRAGPASERKPEETDHVL